MTDVSTRGFKIGPRVTSYQATTMVTQLLLANFSPAASSNIIYGPRTDSADNAQWDRD
jgi:hypothetical protein